MNNYITKVRYSLISKVVYFTLKELKISKYPINLSKCITLLENLGYNIELDTYLNYANFKNLPLKYVKKNIFKSEYGATAFIPKANFYIIFINKINQTKSRQKWTIAHEIGHILLKHYHIMKPLILRRKGINSIQYEILEKESDWFTRTFLCNPFVLFQLNVKNELEIIDICRISKKAAINRLFEINDISANIKRPNKWDILIIDIFKNFINQKYCPICRYKFTSKTAKFCPICGNNNFKWKEVDNYMVYEYKIFEKCEICENTEIHSDSNYCKICGTDLRNYCTNQDCINSNPLDKIPLDNNARYCHICGSKSLFYKKNYLTDWQTEHNNINNTSNNDFVSADDLPF